RNFTTAQSFGSVNQSLNVRPQQVVNVDVNSFLNGFGGSHEVKYGAGYRTTDAITGTLWPGNMILAIENSPTDLRAQVFRQGYGGNRANYLDFYVGDTIQQTRTTIDLGVRFDRQWGLALPSTTLANKAFPTVVPGFTFAGYDSPFTWNNFSPRAVNPANPTAVTPANQIDQNLKAPYTSSLVGDIERELMPNLALQVNYSYTRTNDLFGNFTNTITPRVGVTLADYAPGLGFTGTLPNGQAYSVPTFIPNAARIAAGGNGFLTTTVPGYYTDYHGLEFGVVKRLSNRWMGRAGFSFNNAREHFSDPAGIYDTNGNPTRTVTEPLIDGGQFAPQSGGSGSGTIYINAKWQFNANAT